MVCGRRYGQGARYNVCVRIVPYVHPVDDEAEAAAAAAAVAPPPLPLALAAGVVEVIGLVGMRDPEACTKPPRLLRRGIELSPASAAEAVKKCASAAPSLLWQKAEVSGIGLFVK